MRRIVLTLLVLLVSAEVFCQEKYTINGYIKDSSNGEALIGATVYIKEIANGVTTNVYGFYSITLEPGDYTVQFSYVGYSTQLQSISLQRNLELNVDLEIESETLEEIVIEGELEQANVENTEMSTNKLDIRTILKVPTLLGEADIFRSILLLPGVTTVGEGASGFNVRG
ncbi:MAG TPA: carboxypeptidase-like regulatory domain-containing protein, partial [Cyclobacteriaceae bacterium]|nr:carboxypeptidase-like regulatory domain-containing protein [Cyclobacteriaceae bacterium]